MISAMTSTTLPLRLSHQEPILEHNNNYTSTSRSAADERTLDSSSATNTTKTPYPVVITTEATKMAAHLFNRTTNTPTLRNSNSIITSTHATPETAAFNVTAASSSAASWTYNKELSTTTTTTDRMKTSVSTSRAHVVSNTVDWGNSTNTTAPSSNDEASASKATDERCLSSIRMVSAISAAIVVLVILTSILCMLKIKRKWRHKLREERVKTDIWTMSTFHNTIINENFADYTLAPTPMPPRKDGANSKLQKNSQKTPRSSISSQNIIQSWYSDSSQSSGSLRRNTFSEPNRIGNRFKTRARRQASEYSEDSRFDDGPYERTRTSTFSAGWNAKSRDRSMLMHHQESTDISADGLSVLQPGELLHINDQIVTEL